MAILFLTLDGKKVAAIEATGPSSDVTVGAGGEETIACTIVTKEIQITDILSVAGIGQLPSDLVIKGVSFEGADTVFIHVKNVGASDVTVPAGTVAIKVLCIGH